MRRYLRPRRAAARGGADRAPRPRRLRGDPRLPPSRRGTLLVVAARHDRCCRLARIVAIWASGRAVGIDLSVRPYFVLGPLLFLVMLVPFTINGLAVREAFFVSFLGRLGVSADAAFATGFIFFLMTLILALPGLAIILWEGFRRPPVPAPDV